MDPSIYFPTIQYGNEIITSVYTKNWIAFGTGVISDIGIWGLFIIDDFPPDLKNRKMWYIGEPG
jgi:hypothetical protein